MSAAEAGQQPIWRTHYFSNEPLYGIEHSNHGLISFGGGIPLEDADGNIIGAIGASGSTVDNDVKIAQAGLEVCKKAKSAAA